MRSRALRKIAYRLLCTAMFRETRTCRRGDFAASLATIAGRPRSAPLWDQRGSGSAHRGKPQGVRTGDQIPRRDDPFAGFEFVASPPAGVAMIVAILSDRPVHLVDLPDNAPPHSGQASFDQLFEVARQLRIAREDQPGTLQEPKWSFDAKLYVVR